MYWTLTARSARIKTVGKTPGRVSASAASTFSDSDITELVATAKELPPGWCLAVEPPYGQIALTPIRSYHFSLGAMVVSRTGQHGPIRWRSRLL